MSQLEEVLEATEWIRLYNGRRKGEVLHDDIVSIVRELHIKEYQVMLNLWMEGNLFKYQKASFEVWLDSNTQIHNLEVHNAMEYLAFECGCSETPNRDIYTFIYRRIMRFPVHLKQEISKDGKKRDICKDFWRKENLKHKWDWV